MKFVPVLQYIAHFGHETVDKQHVFKCFMNSCATLPVLVMYVCSSTTHMFAVYGGISVYSFVKYVCLYVCLFIFTHTCIYNCIHVWIMDYANTICRSTMMCICLETIGPIVCG